MVAGDPHQGGATWAVLQYVLGFRRLGHDVWLVEPVESVTEPRRVYFDVVTAGFGLQERAALLPAVGESHGLPYDHVLAAARGADVLVNIAGMLTDDRLLETVSTRLYLDLDPAFTQLWHDVGGIDMRFDGHTHFATVGTAIGTAGCEIPTCGVEWLHTLPPVVLDLWTPGDEIRHDGLTTVGHWRSYGSIEHDGRRYGQRVHSFRELFELPRVTDERLMPALAIHADELADLEALRSNGWELLDAANVAATPEDYRAFVRGSKGELGVAKSGYVVSRCGWFSDRSACYLASGRPVVAQDTGVAGISAAGEGFLLFSTTDEAAAAIEAVRADYARHSRAARELAEASLDSDLVLTRLLDCL